MKGISACVCILAAVAGMAGCKNPFTPETAFIEGGKGAKGWMSLKNHENVIDNFDYVYNFRSHGELGVETAINLYESLFVDTDEPGYSFEFKAIDPKDPDKYVQVYGYDEEMLNAGSLFRGLDRLGLDMELSLRLIDDIYKVELGESSADHPGEDWYVYSYKTVLKVDNPSGGLPYRSEGEVIFKIRKCIDGNYRIVRWEDWTVKNDT